MSLESTYKKLRTIDKQLPIWKLMSMCVSVAIITTGISIIFNPTVLSQIENPVAKTFLVGIITMGFTAMYLTFFVGGLICGISITWILLKSRNKFYIKNGILIAKSLVTNHEFLRKFADAVLPKLIGFIRAYNDPKIESLQNQIIEKDTRINELENLILPHIARQNRNQFDFNYRLKKMEQNKSENIQTIDDKANTKKITENSTVSKDNKFKEDL